MNRKKRNLIILAVTLLLGIIMLLVLNTKSKTTTIEQNYHVEDTATVTKIFMVDKINNKVLLERTENGWMVDKTYPAAQHVIDMLMGTMYSMRIKQPVALAAHANIIKALSASSTKIEIYQKRYFIDWFNGKIKLFPREKLTKVLYMGQETQDNQGTFSLMKGEKSPVILYVPGFRGFLTPRFSANPLTWRSHEIFDLNAHQIQSIKIEVLGEPQESFEIVKRGRTFDMKMLSTGQVLPRFDTAHVADLLSSFVKCNFDKFVKDIPIEEKGSVFAKGPLYMVTVTDTTGNSKWVKTYIKLEDIQSHVLPTDKDDFYSILDVNRMYGLVQGLSDTVMIQYYVFDNILKPASYYMRQPRQEK